MAWEPKKLQDWHLRVIDLLIVNPGLTNEEISLELNGLLGSAAIGLLRRSDFFQLALKERQAHISEAVDQHTLNSITGRVGKLAAVALDTLTEQVQKEQAQKLANPTRQTTETCEMALKSLGYIKGNGGGAPAVQVSQTTVVQVDASTLGQARQMMKDVHAQRSAEYPALPSPQAAGASR